MKRILLFGTICLLLCVSCTVQEAHLVYRPEQTAIPTAIPTASPSPEPISIPAVTGAPSPVDANGVPIFNEKTHYLDYYVELKNIRIYEYEQGTFLDGTLVNGFPQTLTGGLRITFRNAEGVVYGYGDLYTADGGLNALPGENRIYAEIFTEIDVQKMDFTISVEGSFGPQQ